MLIRSGAGTSCLRRRVRRGSVTSDERVAGRRAQLQRGPVQENPNRRGRNAESVGDELVVVPCNCQLDDLTLAPGEALDIAYLRCILLRDDVPGPAELEGVHQRPTSSDQRPPDL